MEAVVDRHALGILQKVPTANRVRFDLLDIRGRPIEVVVSRRDAPGEVLIEVRAGRFGDAELEKAISADLAHRLDQLFGVEVAPIDWSR